MPAPVSQTATPLPPQLGPLESIVGCWAGGYGESWTDMAIYAVIEPIMRDVWTIISTVLGLVKLLWETYGQDVIDIVVIVFGYLRTTIGNIMVIIQGIIETVTGLIEGDWTKVWNGISTIFSGVWKQISEALVTWIGIIDVVTGGWLTGTYNSVLGWLNKLWKDVEEGPIGQFVRAIIQLWDSVRTITKDAWFWLTDEVWQAADKLWKVVMDGPIGTFLFAIRNFTASVRQAFTDMLAGIKIQTPHINIQWGDFPVLGRIPTGVSVDWYARGGNFLATGPMLIGVGERGPERVQITPVGQGGAGSNSTITINYYDQRPNGGPADIPGIARRLQWQMAMRGV